MSGVFGCEGRYDTRYLFIYFISTRVDDITFYSVP